MKVPTLTLEERMAELDNQVQSFQSASMLVGGSGDPSDVTPAMVESYVCNLQRCANILEDLIDDFFGGRREYGADRYILPDQNFAVIDRRIIDHACEALADLPQEGDA